MIPWWGWLLIWVALVLSLVAMLAFGAVRLWRAFGALLDDLGALADRAAVLGDVDPAPPARSVPAILRDAREVRAHRATRIARALERRRRRRVLRLERARRITSIDADVIRWPDTWYR